MIPIEMATQAGGSRSLGEVMSNNVFMIGTSTPSDSITARINARIRFTDA